MKYIVEYKLFGAQYKFKCHAKSIIEAKNKCIKYKRIESKNIKNIYIENEELIKKNLEDTAMRFEDIGEGQYFEWDEHLYLKLNTFDDDFHQNAFNITDGIFCIIRGDNKVIKLVSEIKIEYTV